MRALLLATSAVLLAVAVGLSHGNLRASALALVLAGAACAAGAVWVRPDEPGPGGERLVAGVLGAGLAAALFHNLLRQVGWHATHASMPGFRPTLALAAVLLATHLVRPQPAWLVRWRPAALAAVWLALLPQLLAAVPAPTVDVWSLQQGAAAALFRGENPYAITTPNPYGPGTPLLSPSLLTPDGARILGYPYPPLTVLAGLPAYAALGDVRWAHALLLVGAAAGVWCLGRRSRTAELAAAFVLFQQGGFLLVEQAWTEPVLLAALVWLAVAVERWPGALWPTLLGGLAAASKQYALLLAAPLALALPRGVRARAAGMALGVALLTLAPFALWDARALWHGVVEFQLAQPFRRDSLSLAAALFGLSGVQLPAWPGFVAAGLVVWAGGPRAARVDGALALAVLAWLAFVLLAKQAFANYYLLAVGLLCAAAARAAVAPPEVAR